MPDRDPALEKALSKPRGPHGGMMTQRIGKVILIAPESAQQCDDCGQVSELRPYGPGGSCICHACAMKDLAGTERRMGIILFGDPDPDGETRRVAP